MPFKQLEHNGGEDFSSSTKNRQEVAFNKKEIEKKKEEQVEELKVKAQEKYLHPSNESLWEDMDW